MRRFAKPLYGLKPVPRVRIPPSPPDFLIQAFTRATGGLWFACFPSCSVPKMSFNFDSGLLPIFHGEAGKTYRTPKLFDTLSCLSPIQQKTSAHSHVCFDFG